MQAIVLAGGEGRRLRPYTTVLPKPLMPIGNIPIIEVIIRQLAAQGFDDIVVSVGYLSELVRAYLSDGKRYGTRIRYVKEETPLGTAGPLRLVSNLRRDFLVVNGDILTTMNFSGILNAQARSGGMASTVVTRRANLIDYGIVEMNGRGRMKAYIEKPVHQFHVGAGINAFCRDVLKFIPKGRRFDIPDLYQRLLKNGNPVNCVRFGGVWLDIGREDDYEKAIQLFKSHPAKFFRKR